MMQKRLKIAKKLLNPKDSVLIVTIDEKEYLHLGCLLEEFFPEGSIQMISSVINPAGVSRNGAFARVDEYIYFVQLGNSEVRRLELSDEWRLRPEDKQSLTVTLEYADKNRYKCAQIRTPQFVLSDIRI